MGKLVDLIRTSFDQPYEYLLLSEAGSVMTFIKNYNVNFLTCFPCLQVVTGTLSSKFNLSLHSNTEFSFKYRAVVLQGRQQERKEADDRSLKVCWNST